MMHAEVEVKRQDGTAETLPWPPDEEESVCLAAFLIAVDVAVGTGITRRSLPRLLNEEWPPGLTRPDDPVVRETITTLAQRQPDLLLPFQRFAFAEPSTAEGRALRDGDDAWQDTTEVVLASWNLQNSIPKPSVLDRAYPCLKENLEALHRWLTKAHPRRWRFLLTT